MPVEFTVCKADIAHAKEEGKGDGKLEHGFKISVWTCEM